MREYTIQSQGLLLGYKIHGDTTLVMGLQYSWDSLWHRPQCLTTPLTMGTLLHGFLLGGERSQRSINTVKLPLEDLRVALQQLTKDLSI